ncbi:NACHT domain protein [Coniochaeta sp. 2T2.1]|nr:NACHT domain protein [Coniochaeta sp. 2T2.1]
MSLVLSRASTLKPELRLAQAISEFQKDLSTEQRAAFCSTRDKSVRSPPNYEDVMRLTEEIDRNASKLLKSRRCFGTRFTNILHAIQQFAALGDVIVGGTQNIIACGVWSLVRMTLLTVVNFSSYLEKLSSLLMDVGRSAPRYERLHQLYPRSKALQSQLSEYFIVIVRVCHQLLKMTKKSAFGQLVSFPSDADMKVHESDLKNISAHIKDEVTLLMGQEVREQNSRLSTILRSTEADAHRQRQDTYIRVLSTCSTYDYETTWKETRKQGETSWFRQSTTYQEWKASGESATLAFAGKLGSGKSVMLANIVGDLVLDKQTHDCPVAYFFCRHDIVDSLLCSTIIRSLRRQILRSLPDLSSVDQRFKRNAPFVDSDLVLSILLDLPCTFQAYFVLDGLDECNDQERCVLVAQLRKLQNAFNLRICVACRSDIDNLPTTLLDSLAESTLLALPEENPEIKRFIDAELYDRVESGKLVLGDPQLSLETADALLAGAQGMFLWVALQIEALCAETTDAGIRHALAELPTTLNETFSRILKRANIHETGRSYQTQTFELVIAAHRPLTTDELREALSVIPGDDTWDPAQQLNNVYGALASCGSLIMVDEENLTVRLIHHSVKQFLFTTRRPTQDQSYFADAKRRMCATVLTYLNYGVFDTQLSTTVVPAIPVHGTPYKIIRSMDNASTSRTLALKLLRARRHSSVDIGKVVSEAMKRHGGPVHETFKFYAYAKKYWLKHVWHMTEDRSSTYKLLLKLIIEAFAERGANLEYKNRDGRTALSFAAGLGLDTTVEALIAGGANLEARDNEKWTPLCWAACNGHEAVAIVKLLLSHGANPNHSDKAGLMPLIATVATAGLKNKPSMIKLLLAHGADVNIADGAGKTALWYAARHGEVECLKILVKHGADRSVMADDGSTCWKFRYNLGYHERIQPLLDNGFDVNLKDGSGRTPLAQAAIWGDVRVARILLAHGADLDSKDNDGLTPLQIAEDEEIRTLLLEEAARRDRAAATEDVTSMARTSTDSLQRPDRKEKSTSQDDWPAATSLSEIEKFERLVAECDVGSRAAQVDLGDPSSEEGGLSPTWFGKFKKGRRRASSSHGYSSD